MPATTPTYLLPYPSPSDPADVPTDMHNLASRLEAVFGPGTADGQVPVWNNTTKTWGVTTPAMAKLADVNLSANQATIDFPGIPQTYAHLRIVAHLRSNVAGFLDIANLRLNANSGNNYILQRLRGSGTAAATFESTNVSSFLVGINGASSAPYMAAVVVDIPNYTDSTTPQSILWSSHFLSTLAGGGVIVEIGGGSFGGTPAITQVTFTPGGTAFVAPSRATLYGYS